MQSPTEKKENRKECKPVSGRVSADRKAAGSPAHMGLLLAFALILSYIELLIPFQPGIPGVKLGLSNLAVVLCLYLFGWRKALLLTVVKAIFSGLLFGNLFMILYSLAGAVFSALIMILLKKSGSFHIPVVSGAGGVAHNLGQLLVAMRVAETYGILYYMPMLIIAGLVTGLLIGITAALVLPYLQNILAKGNFK